MIRQAALDATVTEVFRLADIAEQLGMLQQDGAYVLSL